jgi:hypothetical protein
MLRPFTRSPYNSSFVSNEGKGVGETAVSLSRKAANLRASENLGFPRSTASLELKGLQHSNLHSKSDVHECSNE